ncbi:glycosyltransferase family 9 protein, partial [Xanthomonas citri pv. citri]
SDAVTSEFYEQFLDHCDGTLILLDWDQRVPRLESFRVRHLTDFGDCPLEKLLALMTQADLLIGVDSGPLHVSRFTDIPTIGVWQPGHYATTYTLPRAEQLNLVLADHTRQWNRYKRIPWNMVEHEGVEFEARA